MLPTRSLEPHKNKILFFFVTFCLVGLLFYELVQLQVVKGSQYYFNSKNSFSLSSIIRAPRGTIYDRNGVKLVENQSKYDLYIYKNQNPSTFDKFAKTIENLSKLTNQNIQEKYDKEYERIKDLKNIDEVKVSSSLDYNPYIFQIEANPANFPMVKIDETSYRNYLYPELTSHILGYVGEINAEDYKTGRYNYGDTIGKFGVEKTYDDILRGTNGIERIDYYRGDSDRQVSSVVQQQIKGSDIYLTIDINYQTALYDKIKAAFAKEDMKDTISTSAVVEDVKTGQILALASYPTFNSNLFSKGISQEEYNTYLNNPGKPLTNKAIQYAQPPGSTFKTLTDLVALQNQAIEKNTIFSTGGYFEYGGVRFQDARGTNWGNINMVRALCVSSNIYHMKTAMALDQKTSGRAADLMYEAFHKIGLDQKSNLNIGSEGLGTYSTPSTKRAKGQPWYLGDLMNQSIGQGEVKLTAIGAVQLVSTIARKGTIIPQTIILQNQPQKADYQDLGIDIKNYSFVNEGMKCSAARNNPYTKYDTKRYPEVSEKTGTAETGQFLRGNQLIHSWEITFTPSDKPELAMSVFMENGKFGYKSGYISREFYKTWWDQLRGVKI